MRVVHVSDCYAPRLGGIETQVRALAIRQAAAGHDVHVITATAASVGPIAGHSGTEVLDGVQVHRVVSRAALGLPLHPHVAREIRAALTSFYSFGGKLLFYFLRLLLATEAKPHQQEAAGQQRVG